MAQALPRTSFNSSRLVRLLADLDVAEAADAKQSFAERLGQWLDLTDAISLSAALKPGTAGASGSPQEAPSSAIAAVGEEFARVRAALLHSINANGVLNAGMAGNLSTADASSEAEADFSPYHRCYLAHQREMDASIVPLRANARAALAGASPALKQLAAMDAILDEALRARERSLLASMPLLLAKRFDRLQLAHREAPADRRTGERNPPGAWLAAFCRDMQGALLAELDLRLQPVAGLIEALGKEVQSINE